MEFLIESSIPKHKPVRAHGGRASEYAFEKMQIGQSWKATFNANDEKDVEKVTRRVRAAISSFKNRNEGAYKHFVLSTRTVTGKEPGENGKAGLRVFRDPAKVAKPATATV